MHILIARVGPCGPLGTGPQEVFLVTDSGGTHTLEKRDANYKLSYCPASPTNNVTQLLKKSQREINTNIFTSKELLITNGYG